MPEKSEKYRMEQADHNNSECVEFASYHAGL